MSIGIVWHHSQIKYSSGAQMSKSHHIICVFCVENRMVLEMGQNLAMWKVLSSNFLEFGTSSDANVYVIHMICSTFCLYCSRLPSTSGGSLPSNLFTLIDVVVIGWERSSALLPQEIPLYAQANCSCKIIVWVMDMIFLVWPILKCTCTVLQPFYWRAQNIMGLCMSIAFLHVLNLKIALKLQQQYCSWSCCGWQYLFYLLDTAPICLVGVSSSPLLLVGMLRRKQTCTFSLLWSLHCLLSNGALESCVFGTITW